MGNERIAVALGVFPGLLRRGLTALLQQESGVRLLGVSLDLESLQRGSQLHGADVVVLDERLAAPELLHGLRVLLPAAGLVMLTGDGESPGRDAFDLGAPGRVSIRAAERDISMAIRLAADRRPPASVVAGAHREPLADGGLTPRELQTLAHLSRGMSNLQIAERMGVSVETVKSHVKQVLRKCRVESRRELLGTFERHAQIRQLGESASLSLRDKS